MTLLEAINIGLSALGEFRVTSAEDRHPTADILRSTIASKQMSLLERGWWFNQYTTTMYPADDGTVEYPVNAISVLGYDGRVYTMRGGMLFDMDNNTQYFTKPAELLVTEDLDFEDLPDCAANFVAYSAAKQQYINDLGVDANVRDMEATVALNWATMEMLHLRNRRYSTRQTRQFRSYRRALLNS